MKRKIKIAETTDKKEITPITKVFVNKRFPESNITILSAIKLFKKCATIGTNIFSVLIYKIDIHKAKINAEVIFPKPCKAANNNEVINIDMTVGTINFNLLNKTPLKINSSEIGEIITVAMKFVTINE